MTWRQAALMVVVGLVGGFQSGLFGVGGGLVLVPMLVAVLGLDARRAAATSLAAIVPTGLAGAAGYARAGHIDLRVAVVVAVGSVVGSWIGTRLLRRVPVTTLTWMFVGLMVVAAAQLAFGAPGRDATVRLTVASVAALVGVGLLAGVASGLFGVGGGIVMVPALVLGLGTGDLLAKGTSLAVIVPTALSGTWHNLRAGMVDLRQAGVVGVAAAAGSPAGVALAGWLSPRVSAWLFATLMLVNATQMVSRMRRRPRPAAGPSQDGKAAA